MKTKTFFLFLYATFFSFSFLFPSIVEIISIDTKKKALYGKALDNPSEQELGKLGGKYYLWKPDGIYSTTETSFPIAVKQENFVAFSGLLTEKNSSFLMDKDWFVLMKLISSKGDLAFALSHLQGDEKKNSAFEKISTMNYEEFKIFLSSILFSRIKMVESYVQKGLLPEESSLLFLYFTMADFLALIESDFHNASHFYEKGTTTLDENKKVNRAHFTKTMIHAGDNFLNLGDTKKALAFYEKAKFFQHSNQEINKQIDIRMASLLKTNPTKTPPKNEITLKRQKIVASAINLIDKSWTHNSVIEGKKFMFDCSGTVARIYWENGIDLKKNYDEKRFANKNGVYILYHSFVGKTHKRAIPNPGDLVFFDNTYDKNRDGKWNDELVHVGVVEKTDSDATITFIHHCSKGIKRYKMNLKKPTVYNDANTGKVYNSYIRRKKPTDPPGMSYVSGFYFSSFATIIGEKPTDL